MKRTLLALAASVLLVSPVNGAVDPARGDAAPDPDGPVRTFFRLLVGHPDPAPGGESVLVIPGTVLATGGAGDTAATDVLKFIDDLKSSYRLGAIDVASSSIVPFTPGQSAEVASIEGGPQITATLVQSDEQTATYRISLSENGKVLAEPTIRERLGGRAVVGTRNGPAAPYVFLLVEPLRGKPAFPRSVPPGVAEPVSEPKAVKKVQPSYPEEARKARFQGLVVLDCTIGTDGRVKSCNASRREPMGLTEAAISAVAQWEFEPARDANGRPIEVVFSVTIRFALS